MKQEPTLFLASKPLNSIRLTIFGMTDEGSSVIAPDHSHAISGALPSDQSTTQAASRVLPVRSSVQSTRITKLVLDGFKSFGKRTELLLGEDFNAILGPNGSGKSNVLDALCFVLGKSSSKQLRAEKSSNLIYNGGKTKNPSKQAEVSICFDNSNNTFPLSDDEVKLSRIVGSDGTSKYKINGKTRTRQEVLEMLAAARINPDGYNIILQGDIIRLVEMSPTERRMIIEEIAGISTYEEKKQHALNDLQKVEEKLSQAGIILREREGFLKDLKKDRDQAITYKHLLDELKTYKASYCNQKMEKKKKDQQSLEQKTSVYRENIARSTSRIQTLRQEILLGRERIKQLSQEIEQKGEVEQVCMQKELEQLRIDIATDRTKAQAFSLDAQKAGQRIKQLQQTKKTLEEAHLQIKNQHQEITQTKKVVHNQLNELTSAIAAFKKRNALGEETNTLEQEITLLDQTSETLQKELQQLREQQQTLLREKDKIEFQLQTIDEQIAKVQHLEDENKEEVSLLKKKKDQFKKLILELNELLNTDSKHAAELAHSRQRVVQLREHAAKLEIKHSSVQDQIAENIAVKKVLENKNQLGEIYGTVAELGQADKEYAQALEVAAAQKLQSIVVEDDKTAANCIKFLKKNQFGIATFLPLNKIRPVVSREETKKLLNEKGVRGMAIDLIEFDPKFRAVFSHVFGNTLVVDTIEIARKIGVGTTRMVTLEGDLCEPSGAMIGGYRHKKIAGFKEKGLADELTCANNEIAALDTKIQRLEESRKDHDEQITRLREVKANLEGDIIKTEKSLHLETSDLDANQKYKQELQQQHAVAEKELSRFEDLVNEKTQALTGLKIKKQELREKLSQIRNPTILAELNAYEQKNKELTEQRITLDAELKSIVQRIESGAQELTNATTVIESIHQEQKLAKESEVQLTNKVTEQETRAHAKDQELAQFYAQCKHLFEQRNVLSDTITNIENQVFKQEEHCRKEEFELNLHAVQEASINAELAGLQSEYQQYEGVVLDTKKTEEQLKTAMVTCETNLAGIGAVNMRALDIYEAAEKEYNTLVDKKSLLATEKEHVLTFMQEIETQKTSLFLDTLLVVNNNFKNNFLDLSKKGDAELILESPEHPFDAGLLINVRLAGDKFLDIRSLSGGEKTMTALAFLFAIQDHEPAPFYVLDEVDAALDKHNSEKLAKLVRAYTGKAQYIVISHNDAVLSEADTLYGVSMNEHGISQVVSVRA